MGTILEHLQTQRDNVDVVNSTDATAITIAANTILVMVDPVNTVVQPIVISQSLFPTGPSRFVVAYPWGMPHNCTPQFASGNPFMSYQPFDVSSSNRNFATFLWGILNHFSAQGVKTEETHPPIMNVDNAEDQEPEYMGPPITFQIPAQPVQSNPYVFAAMVPPFPNNVMLQYAHSGAPLALNVQPVGSLLKRTLQLHRL